MGSTPAPKHGTPLAMLVGGAVAFLGAFVLCGWYVQTLKLVTLAENYVPMQASTALGFVAVGFSVMAYCLGWRRIAFWGGTLAAGIGSLALAETVLGQSQVLTAALADGSTRPLRHGSTSPITAVCFALSGCLLISYRAPAVSRRWRQTATTMVGSVIVAAGCAGLLSYVAEPPGQSWSRLLLMSDAKTAVGFVGIGVAFFLLAGHFRDRAVPRALPSWTTGAIVAALTLGLWINLTSSDARLRRTAINWVRQTTVDHLELAVNRHLRALNRVVERYDQAETAERHAEYDEGLSTDVRLIMDDVPGLVGVAVLYTDRIGHVIETPEHAGHLQAALAEFGPLAKAVNTARMLGRSAVTEPAICCEGSPCFYVVIPRIGSRGAFVFKHRADPFVDHLLGTRVLSVFDVQLSIGDGPAFYWTSDHHPQFARQDHGTSAELQVTGEVAMGDLLWHVEVASVEPWVAGRRNVANTLILWFGLFLAVAIAVVVQKTKSLHERAESLSEAKRTIEMNAASLRDANRALKLQARHLVQAEARIRQTDQDKRRVLDSLSAFVIGVDSDGHVVEWNRVSRDLFGLDARDTPFDDLTLPWDRGQVAVVVARCLANGRRERLDRLAVRVPWDKEKHIVAITVSPTLDERGGKGFSIIGADVTEKLQLEMQLQQAHRLEAVGTLAAGIAHEINTPMQYVGDNLRFIAEQAGPVADLLRMAPELAASTRGDPVDPMLAQRLDKALEDLDVDFVAEELPRALSEAMEGSERVTTIVRAMKNFSHPGAQGKKTADLNEAIRTTLEVARNEYKYHADVETDFGELPQVECFLADLNQVFLNLVINAAHAIGDKLKDGGGERGKITLRTRHSGNDVEIRVSDTGTGIPPEARPRVFDQFFTTKEPGRGTGQGLALAWSVICDKHGGSITFETEQNVGTTFIVRIPVRAPPTGSPSRDRAEADPVRG